MTSKPSPVDREKTLAVKTWLQRYGEACAELDHLSSRIDELRAKVEGAGVSRLDGMPRGTSSPGDRLGLQVAILEDLEAEAGKMVEECKRLYQQIDQAIGRIKASRRRADMVAALRARYLDGFPWPEISGMLFGDHDDYEDRRDSYLRRTHRLHGEALAELAELLKNDDIMEGDKESELRTS
ncbi:MAG: hypothetical protein IKB65_09470 [Ruminiclostridium sp.]|nr:hypothetical protein [Ruminiclostridium sp.]